jgi:hypothetical protein
MRKRNVKMVVYWASALAIIHVLVRNQFQKGCVGFTVLFFFCFFLFSPVVPLNTCVRINIDNKVPLSDSLPLNQRESPSINGDGTRTPCLLFFFFLFSNTVLAVVGVWSANDRPLVVAMPVYSEFRTWFKLKLGNNAAVWSAYGMTKGTQWFSACSPPKTTQEPDTTRAVTTTTTTGATAAVTTSTTLTTEPADTTRTPPTQCADAFTCEACVQRGCQFCYDSAAFTIAVPGVCSANCSQVPPRNPDAPIVALEQPAHCASLNDFIKSKEEEMNVGTGPTDTTVLHFCLVPSTTCPRCVNRIGCYWCNTGYCVHDPAMCDVPLLLQSEAACPERMTTFNGDQQPTGPLLTTKPDDTGLADLLDLDGLETWQLGLAIGGGLLVCLMLLSLVFVCYLRYLKKKQLPNLSSRTKESTVHIFSDDTTFPSATFSNHNSGASFGSSGGSGTSFGQFSTVRSQQTYGQGTTYGNPYY